jgi:hypothetical protein
MDSNEIFIKCECGAEGMMVNHDSEYSQYYFSYWRYGSDPRGHSLWHRIKYAMQVIFRGKIWNDEIILGPREAKELVEFINKTQNENRD